MAHISCIYFGPQCFQSQMAPELIINSAETGSWLAPVATIVVSALFLTSAFYALSGARIIRKAPLLILGIYAISCMCIVRSISGILLAIAYPESFSKSSLVVEIV